MDRERLARISIASIALGIAACKLPGSEGTFFIDKPGTASASIELMLSRKATAQLAGGTTNAVNARAVRCSTATSDGLVVEYMNYVLGFLDGITAAESPPAASPLDRSRPTFAGIPRVRTAALEALGAEPGAARLLRTPGNELPGVATREALRALGYAE
jgi:hypothetical protein